MKTSAHYRLRVFLIGLFSVAFAFSGSTALLSAKNKKKEPPADYALIKGSVFREDGFSIQGAKVTCRRATDKKPKWETTSSEGGEFAFRVPVGKMEYIVMAEMKGFDSTSKKVDIVNDERQDISIILPSKKP